MDAEILKTVANVFDTQAPLMDVFPDHLYAFCKRVPVRGHLFKWQVQGMSLT